MKARDWGHSALENKNSEQIKELSPGTPSQGHSWWSMLGQRAAVVASLKEPAVQVGTWSLRVTAEQMKGLPGLRVTC